MAKSGTPSAGTRRVPHVTGCGLYRNSFARDQYKGDAHFSPPQEVGFSKGDVKEVLSLVNKKKRGKVFLLTIPYIGTLRDAPKILTIPG